MTSASKVVGIQFSFATCRFYAGARGDFIMSTAILETTEERDITPEPGADFVEETSEETKAIWHQYRTFRRSVITLEALETQLGATLESLVIIPVPTSDARLTSESSANISVTRADIAWVEPA